MKPMKRPETRGQRIKRLRKQLGLTQTRLAERCGVHVSFVSAIERDQAPPGRRLLFGLAKALNVTPEYLETGKESPEQEAERARHAVWPEIIYTLSNHAAIGLLLLDDREIETGDEAIRAAIDQARCSLHFCQFLEWVGSQKSKEADSGIGEPGALEHLVGQYPTDEPLKPQVWIDLREDKRIARVAAGWELKAHPNWRVVYSAAGCVGLPPKSIKPAELFEPDIAWVSGLHAIFVQGSKGRELAAQDVFRKSFIREAFVTAAFPDIFWAIARTWTDRRLEGWLSYLGLEPDVYVSLGAAARHTESPQLFRRLANWLLRECAIEDCEIMLATLPDIYVRALDYQRRYEEQVLALRVEGVGGGGFGGVPDRTLLDAHRRIRRQARSQLLLDLIFKRGTEKMQADVDEFLECIAPPHQFIDDANLVDNPKFLPPGTKWPPRRRKRKKKPSKKAP